MAARKCRDCEHVYKAAFPRSGNGGSWRSGRFSQEGCVCKHPKNKNVMIFYGQTSPRSCPLRKKEE